MTRRFTVWPLVIVAAAGCGGSSDADRNQVTLRVEGPGAVHVDPDGFNCDSECVFDRPDGARLFLTALPDRGARLTSWSSPCSTADPRCTIRSDGASTITAIFAPSCPEPWSVDASDVVDMATHPGGWLVTTGSQTSVWDTVSCEPLWRVDRTGTAVTFDTHGNVFIAEGNTIALLAGPNGFPLWERTVEPEILDVGVDADNRFAAVGQRGGMGWLGSFDGLDGSSEWEREPGPGTIPAMATDGDSFWVAGTWEGLALVAGYRTETRADRFQLTIDSTTAASSIGVLPNGEIAAIVHAETTQLRRFDPEDGSQLSATDTVDDTLAGPFLVGTSVVYIPTGQTVGELAHRATAAAHSESHVYLAVGDRIQRLPAPE